MKLIKSIYPFMLWSNPRFQKILDQIIAQVDMLWSKQNFLSVDSES